MSLRAAITPPHRQLVPPGTFCYSKAMKMHHDYVAIKRDALEEKTESGIILVQQIKSAPPYGTVKYVADSVTEINPGDRVIYKVYASVEVDLEGGLDVLPVSGVLLTL